MLSHNLTVTPQPFRQLSRSASLAPGTGESGVEVLGWHSLPPVLLPEPRLAASVLVSCIRLPWGAQLS